MTPTETAAMTLDQLRDWCAVDDGWQPPGTAVFRRDGTEFVVGAWTRRISDGHYEHNSYDDAGTGSRSVAAPTHPYPATIDGAAKAMPEGWVWDRYRVQWSAFKKVNGLLRVVRTPDTDDEIADRYRLAVLCRVAAREANK